MVSEIQLIINKCMLVLCVFITCSPSTAFAQNIEFGLNGHPFTQIVFKDVNIKTQLDLVKEIGAKWYRVDVKGDALYPQRISELKELVVEAKKRGLKVLPIIFPPVALNSEDNLVKIYNISFMYSKNLVSKFKNDINVWELNNELDNYALLRKGELTYLGHLLKYGVPDGINSKDYDIMRTKKVMALLKGLSDGVCSADPGAKRIINAGWIHWGIFEHIVENNIGFEIIGWHWYSDMGDIANIKGKINLLDNLKKYNRPIWITETNRRGGSYGSNGNNEQAKYLENSLFSYIAYSKKYPIEKVFIYELLDDPPLGHNNPEAYYGLLEVQRNMLGKWEIKSKKHSFNAVKTIFSIKSANYN